MDGTVLSFNLFMGALVAINIVTARSFHWPVTQSAPDIGRRHHPVGTD